MFFNKVIFVIKESFNGLFKNVAKSLIQLLVCFISLVCFAIIFGIHFNANNVSSDMREKIEISVFVKDEATDEEILGIENIIKNTKEIKSYEFINKETAYTKGIEMYQDTPELLTAIDGLDNPFPSSFNIQLHNEENTDAIVAKFKGIAGVDEKEIRHGEEYMDKILVLSKILNFTSYIGLAFFFVVAVFFMVSIINAILASKQQESKIMYLVGASPIQIKLPFYIQGALLGTTSAVLAYIAFIKGYSVLVGYMGTLLADISPVKDVLMYTMLFSGFVTGLVATKVALRTFNKASKKTSKIRKVSKLKKSLKLK